MDCHFEEVILGLELKSYLFPDSQISCQTYYRKKNKERALFDFQIVRFLDSTNAIKIAAIHPSAI
jgi:hypothetical protein